MKEIFNALIGSFFFAVIFFLGLFAGGYWRNFILPSFKKKIKQLKK